MTLLNSAKILLTILCTVFIISGSVYGQNKVLLDSVKRVIATTPTTSKQHIDALNTLAYTYSKGDTALAFKYAADAKNLAEKIKYTFGIAEAYDAIGSAYSGRNMLNQALKNFTPAVDLFTKIGNKNKVGVVYGHTGNAYKSTGNLKEAMTYFVKAEEIHRETKDLGQLGADLSNKGSIYIDQGNNMEAIKHYIEAGKLFAQSGNALQEAQLLSNIGNLLRIEKNYKEATKYYDSAIGIFEKNNSLINMGLCYLGYSNIYAEQSDYSNWIKYLNKASDVFQKANFARGVASCYNNIGAIYIRTGKYTEAIPYLEKSIAVSEAGKAYVGIPLTQQNIAYAYTKMGDHKLAAEWFDKAERDAKNYKADLFTFMEIYNHRSSLDSAMGNYQKAFLLRNKYLVLKDSLLNEKLGKQVNELQIKYQTEKKESQIALLDKENVNKTLQLQNQELEIGRSKFQITAQQQALTINQLELKNKNQKIINQQLDVSNKEASIAGLKKVSDIQKLELTNRTLQLRQRNIAIFAISAMLIVGALAGYGFYNRNKLKQEARLQAEVHKQQEIETRSLFEGEQKERIRIARDLHDSIGQMLSVIKMNVSNIQHEQPGNKITGATLELVDNTIIEVRNISHNLIPEELNFGLFTALEDMCDKVNQSNTTQVSINVPDEVREHQFEKTNELSIYRIVQEVLSNMVKHSQASQIAIDVLQHEKNLTIAIKDNGKGFDTAQINKSKGLGWKNIAARVNMLDGKMQVRSEQLTGTQIEITIPGA